MLLNPDQLETARVAVWLMARSADAAGAWIETTPADLAREVFLSEPGARRVVAGMVARGHVALEKRGGVFWLLPTTAGRGPLSAYVLGFAASKLGA